jgi:hypothetical protein
MDDGDLKIALLACEICLSYGSAVEGFKTTRRLIDLLAHSDSILRNEIQQLFNKTFCRHRGPN